MSQIEELHTFYKNRFHLFQEQAARIKRQLFASSMLRLLVFCAVALGVSIVFGNTKWVFAILLVGIVSFLYLVSRHTDLQRKRDKLKALAAINETEIKVLDRDFHDLPDGGNYKDPGHFYSQDIDLFGRGSFYQYLNRTALEQGSETLARLLLENTIDRIDEKQEAINELAGLPEWRQEFSAIAKLTKTDAGTDAIVHWLERYHPFVPKIMSWLPWVFSGASVLLLGGYFAGFLSGFFPFLWIFLGLGISSVYTKKIGKLTAHATKIQSAFRQYNKLLILIENQAFSAELLKEQQDLIRNEQEKTSSVLRRFSKLLNGLDKNNNVFYLFLANGYFLRGLFYSHQIEKWIHAHGPSVASWFHTVAFFDAYNTLGNFAFNHPMYVFPKIVEKDIILKSTDAGHPLLNPAKSIVNDFYIGNEEFIIITGANMAGKSTFLRTVSLQIMMANIGLPICAGAAEYVPIKLITSMRTTDSLTDDESYFFSELKRLKFIVEEIQNDRYFIVLDEILKGTNSTDKAKGSRQFVERLVGSKSTGIIATHDLSLCDASKEWSQIKNYYFDAEIIDNELHFDYRFKKGICQNMNASFLLKKMGIVE